MSDQPVPAWDPPPPPEPTPAERACSARGLELRLSAALLVAMLVVGALLGLLWAALSPTQPPGQIYSAGILTTETEQWAATDGRYVFITATVGLVAGLAAWFLRAARGPMLALALGVGALGGAQLTELIGRVWRGGSSGGKIGAIVNPLPLEVHMHGLYFVEAAVALLVFGLCVAFAAADDLGRPDRRVVVTPVLAFAGAVAASVRYDGQLQDSTGHGDRPGASQQDQFPPQ